MKANSLPSVLVALGSGSGSAEPDADLLARFVASRDQTAFAELVRRYSRLVWRVARTRCRTAPAAEDVFQAAFVVLSRKAGSIRATAALAGWLHRTAHRLAVRAAKKERPAVPLPPQLPTSADPLDALTARELFAAVDDEMAKLSDAERTVLVLCGIDGLANDEAARRLGTTPGGVKGRLERARTKLRERLTARGLTIPAVALGLIGGPSAAAVQAAFTIPFGGAIPPGVERLVAEGLSMKGMMTKAVGVLALAAVMIGGFIDHGPAPNATAAPVPKAAATAVVWSEPVRVNWKDSGAEQITGAWTPDGKSVVVPAPLVSAKDEPLPGGGIDFRDAATGQVKASIRYPHTSATAAFQTTALAVDPNGKTVVAGGTAFETNGPPETKEWVLQWDVGGGKPRLHGEWASTRITCVGVSPDGKVVLTADASSNLFQQEPAGRSQMSRAHAANCRVAYAYSPNGKYLIAATDKGTVVGLENVTGGVVGQLEGHDAKFRAVAVSPDGKRIAAGGEPGNGKEALAVIDDVDETSVGKQFRDIKDAVPAKEWINGLAFSPDGKRLAAACSDGRVRVFDAENGKLVVSAKEHTAEVFSVAYSPDGKQVLTVGRDAIKVWSVDELMKAEDVRAKPAPDTRRKNAPVPKAAEPEKLVLWSERFDATKGYSGTHGIWTPDGKHVLTGGQVPGEKGGEWPGELRVWDVDTGKLVHTHRGEISYVTRPTTVAITPDGKTLAVAGYGNTQPRRYTLDVFDWGEGKPRASLRLNKPATGVLLSADGKTLITLDMRGDVTARDVKTERLLWTSALGNQLNWGLSFGADEKAILVADEGGAVRRFEAGTGKPLPPLGQYDIKALGLSVAKDETRVAVGGYAGKGPLVIDCKDGVAGEFRNMKLPANVQANQVSLSPDGKHLAVACSGKENVLKVFDAATGDLLVEGKEHAGAVSCARYSPDGKRLLTVGPDAVKVWSVKELMKAAK